MIEANTKFFVVSERDIDMLKRAAEHWGNYPPGEEERRRIKALYEKIEAACRARPVPEFIADIFGSGRQHLDKSEVERVLNWLFDKVLPEEIKR